MSDSDDDKPDADVPDDAPDRDAPDDDAPDDDKPARAERPSQGRSTAQGRAAQRKVRLEGSKAGSDAPPPKRAPAPKPPLYRRGGFWFWVIVAEVLVALFLSYRFERPTDSVSLDGGDIPMFCAYVSEFRAAGAADTSAISVDNAPERFQADIEAYKKLRDAAPTDLKADLDKIILVTDDLSQAAIVIRKDKQADPTSLGASVELLKKQNEAGDKLKVANARLELVVKQACGVDLNEAPPTTAVPPGGTGIGPVTTQAGSSGTTSPPGSTPGTTTTGSPGTTATSTPPEPR